ncbi:MAG: DUF4160 domain-containing protein [Thermodesulfobacteriota bacterium]
MPTLLIRDGFKFFFYVNDHEPMHIHVMKGGDFAKIDLTTLQVVRNEMKSNELKRALSIVKKEKTNFIRKWHEYFRQRRIGENG